MPLFGNEKGLLQAVVGLLRVARLEDGRAGGDGVAAGVLLVLAGGHAGVVRDDDDEAAVDAGVGGREERVCGDVEADMLHRGDDASVTESGADGDLQGDLFVGRPLGIAAEFGELFEDFGARRARIARAEIDACVERRVRDCLVAVEKKSLVVHWRSFQFDALQK